MKTLIPLLSLMVLLSGCFTIISDQTRTLVNPKVKYEEVQANPDGFLGTHLLVGGRIVASSSTNELSTMEIEQVPTDAQGVPFDLDKSAGRFIAESTTYYDSSMYVPGSVVTMVGEVTGKRSQLLNGTSYLYPVLAIKEIYHWDPEKFRAQNSARPENPYSATYDKPLPVRPLEPLIPRRY